MTALLTLLYVILCALILIFVPVLASPHVAQYGVISVFDTARAVLLVTALASLAGYYALQATR